MPTREFLHGLTQGSEIEVELERGKSLLLAVSAIGEPDDRGMRQVVCTVNGQMRVVSVRDESVQSTVAVAERFVAPLIGTCAGHFDGLHHRDWIREALHEKRSSHPLRWGAMLALAGEVGIEALNLQYREATARIDHGSLFRNWI